MLPQVTLRRMAAKRTYHHGHLRDAVLDAARRMVSTAGTDGVSLRALARATGVSHAAIYKHFVDREALLAELSTEALLALARSQRLALSRATSTVDGLCRLGVAYLRFGMDDPARLRLAFAPEFARSAGYPLLRAAADAAEAPAIEAVTRAADDGLLPHRAIRERAVAHWAMVHGYTLLAIDGRLTEGRLSVAGTRVDPLARALSRAIRLSYGAG